MVHLESTAAAAAFDQHHQLLTSTSFLPASAFDQHQLFTLTNLRIYILNFSWWLKIEVHTSTVPTSQPTSRDIFFFISIQTHPCP